MHISSDILFSKILKKPSIAQKKIISHMNKLLFFFEMKQKKFFFWKKNQNGRLKNKTHFPAPPILNIFSWNFYGLVLGLVELIDAKGIEMSQLIWSWGCPT